MNDKRERELAEEIEFHRAMRERKYREQHGVSAQQAADKTKRDFGGFEKWKEVCRDVGRWRLLDEFWRDLILAVRMLRKSPVFTVLALFTLTLAIGANTAIFSLMNELMLKSLPVPEVKRLVLLSILPGDFFGQAMSYPLFRETEKQTASVMQTFAFEEDTLKMRGAGGVQKVDAELVSGKYFSALDVHPILGRWIIPDDEQVAVVTEHFWRTQLNGDRNALGRTIVVENTVLTVIGVMPEWFRGMNRDYRSDLFIPLELEPVLDAPENDLADPADMWHLQVGARLNGGVSMEQANVLLATKSGRFWKAVTGKDHFELTNHQMLDISVAAQPGATGYSFLRLRFKDTLLVLMALVALVLLIACLNLATLLMARAALRGREMSTRFALGATRARLLRQLLTESLLLAVIGTMLGLAVSPALAALVRTGLGYQGEVAPDYNIFLFTAAVITFATVLTGTLPAMQLAGNGINGPLRGAEKRRLWPRVLLSLEVALALVLVTGASLLGYSLLQEHRIETGFQPRGLVYLRMEMLEHPSAYQDVVNELRKLPNVTGAALTRHVPFAVSYERGDVSVPGSGQFRTWRNEVGPDYFQTMKMQLLQGRDFRWSDAAAPARKVILSESAAQKLFPHGHAVGHQISIFQESAPADVIGVVTDVRHLQLTASPEPTIYISALENISAGSSFLILVRTSAETAPLLSMATQILKRLVPAAAAPTVFRMDWQIADELSTERTMTMLASFFGGLALLMTGIGLYGTLAYATERRTGEIGIRLALGAMPRNVISMVCAENGVIALMGCLMGMAGSVFASRMIKSYLYGVSAHDPVVFGLAALMLLGVAAFASLVPAVRASSVDPVAAIRHE